MKIEKTTQRTNERRKVMFYPIEFELTPRTTVDHVYLDGIFFCSTKRGNGERICKLFNAREINSLETAEQNLTHEEKLRFLFATHAIFSDAFSYCAAQKFCSLKCVPKMV